MSEYRRWRVEGGTYFFTVVTYQRRRILTSDMGRSCLREAIRAVRTRRPTKIVAVCLLPDHLHCVLELPCGDTNYSVRLRQIKTRFTQLYLAGGGCEVAPSESQKSKSERGVWQRRFYEHTCRDEADLKRCVDYTHVNPVKHRLVEHVVDWPWSSFHRYVRLGEYDQRWGSREWFGDEFSRWE